MKRIDAVYQKLKELDKRTGVSASEIADSLGLSRANASNDLNKLCKEGKAVKVGKKPVLFKLVEDISEDDKKPSLDKFLEKNPSLFSAVEQAKAAILYPPHGMHMLILGETGVGKSMFAELIHGYAIEIGRMSEDSPFIVFNCADYANNPQLLVSQLFGCQKGAYTGADCDKAGLIEKADGGIFFLDEIHRLPPEGQEMLFTLMDKGTFRRLGESDIDRKSNALIISATTENPNSILLNTFMRRIPMIIRLPNLKERSMEERFNLICHFIREESSKLSRQIIVSVNSMKAFLSYNCPNNIGQLKTDIQLACAKAYADFILNKKEEIKISSIDLPQHIRNGLYMETEHRQLWNKFLEINKRYYVFDKNEESILLEGDESKDNIYEIIDLKMRELKSKGLTGKELDREMEKDIRDYFKKYFYKVNKMIDVSDIENIVGVEIIKTVEEIIKFAEKQMKKESSKELYCGMALHIYNAVERIKRNRKIINPQLNKIRTEHSKEFNIALDCLKIIERTLDISMPIDEAGFLTMLFVYDGKEVKDQENENVKVIVIAHGNATATSMAETANSLLGTKYAIGINAPLDEKPQQVISRLKTYLKNTNLKSDILFLVDMGSLATFGEEIEKEFGIRTKTIPLVSTLHVIEATRKAMMGNSLDEVYDETLKVNAFIESDRQSEDMSSQVRGKMLIATICTTGEGSAVAIKNILEQHLDYDDNIFEIVPINLVGAENVYSKLRNIEKENKVLCIVSSFKIDTSIPQYGLHEVLSLEAIKSIQKLIDVENTYLKMGDTLSNQLKNINSKEALKDIRKFISSIENELNMKVDSNALIGIALHIACMIDKLRGGDSVDEFFNREEYILQNYELYYIVKKSCESLNTKYDISILDDEICYIMTFFNYKTILSNTLN
ncbi:PTS system transcriptional activator [Tepidanaerobacter acetatoxydans Re1]|uniref:PTS system transcriptional activator n=1 Tax=Tepidanaerobacter acetatoxydans (strain DSM 21804 / JCM 16047 / Re1) TaxID=1209989 RepID=F4LWQ9_TEPAE|nr:sigma-54-dependent transcriptional regulator [Tepidanaerobacter acetatoxydans]AEE91781.1 PTS system transcriptional activator [Tepidanaerobacter acetatoxydans Re1]CCP26563.1 PTS system transcriptional activator [Tepidanaerobacter acetatoxydans Re1]